MKLLADLLYNLEISKLYKKNPFQTTPQTLEADNVHCFLVPLYTSFSLQDFLGTVEYPYLC